MFSKILRSFASDKLAERARRAEFYREWDRARLGAFSERERAEVDAIFARASAGFDSVA